jgi:hypothetical protein
MVVSAEWHSGCSFKPAKEKKTMKRIAMLAIAGTVALGSTVPAQAADIRVGVRIGQPGYRDNRDYRRYDVERIAFDNGYRDGLRDGNRDDWRNERFAYRDERNYRDADNGYRREYGARWEYASAYRRGFEQGYRRAYDDYRGRRGRR